MSRRMISDRIVVSELSQGFRVAREGRVRLTVQLLPEGLWQITVSGHGRERPGLWHQGVRLLSRGTLARRIAEGIGVYRGAQRRRMPGRRVADLRREIAPKIHLQFARLIEPLPEVVRDVHRAVLAASGPRVYADPSRATVLEYPPLYDHPWLSKDIRQYRAAATALALPGSTGPLPYHSRDWRDQEMQLLLLTQGDGWKRLFAPEGKVYGALERTLMQLPAGVPMAVLESLGGVRLQRPVTDRTELVALLAYVGSGGPRGYGPRRQAQQLRCFMWATRDQIEDAARLVSEHTHSSLHVASAAHVGRLVRFLNDYPDGHDGNLVGLAKKAIQWHIHNQEEERLRTVERYRGRTIPRLPRPVGIDGIAHLDTVERIVIEGENMGHCVATYVGEAVTGQCAIFHVERAGECATVQVVGDRVTQALGPGNTRNGAAEWGEQMLTRWAAENPLGDADWYSEEGFGPEPELIE